MRVVIRADATATSGAGHVMRCWALAEEIWALGATVTWLGRIDVPWVRRALDEMPWPLQEPHGSSVEQSERVAADLVIVDSYEVDNAYREGLLNRGIPVVAITDHYSPHMGSASLYVNPGAYIDHAFPKGVASLNGPEYALIRRGVRELREVRERKLRSDDVHGLTFILGGTDFGGLASEVRRLQRLRLRMGAVFAGPSPQATGGSINWIEGGQQLLQRAAQSRLVVSAAGVSSWELAHIGVPLALIQVTENQSGNYQWMTQQGWAWPLGQLEHGWSQSLEDQVKHAVGALESGRLEGSSRIDGLGARRVAMKALSLL